MKTVREQKMPSPHINVIRAHGYFKLYTLNLNVNPLFISPFPNLLLLDGLRLQGPRIPARLCWLRILGSVVSRHPRARLQKSGLPYCETEFKCITLSLILNLIQ